MCKSDDFISTKYIFECVFILKYNDVWPKDDGVIEIITCDFRIHVFLLFEMLPVLERNYVCEAYCSNHLKL